MSKNLHILSKLALFVKKVRLILRVIEKEWVCVVNFGTLFFSKKVSKTVLLFYSYLGRFVLYKHPTFCKKNSATIIFRGLRAVSDFEYEFQLAGMNRKLDNKIETVFLMSDVEKQVISSKFVKEIAKLDGKINNFVTKSTVNAIKEKI